VGHGWVTREHHCPKKFGIKSGHKVLLAQRARLAWNGHLEQYDVPRITHDLRFCRRSDVVVLLSWPASREPRAAGWVELVARASPPRAGFLVAYRHVRAAARKHHPKIVVVSDRRSRARHVHNKGCARIDAPPCRSGGWLYPRDPAMQNPRYRINAPAALSSGGFGRPTAAARSRGCRAAAPAPRCAAAAIT